MSDPPSVSTPEDAPRGRARYVDPTGVPGLDDVLGGGLPRAGLTIVTGPPGSGKTILAAQIAFAGARAGRRAVITTAFSERPGKLLEHLDEFSFFDAAQVGDAVQILSLQRSMDEGLGAVADEIIAVARQSRAGVVVVDGFSGVRGVESDPHQARRFLYRVAGTLGAFGVSVIVTNEANPRDPAQFPEATTGDAIIGLYYALGGARHRRGIEAIKVRGAVPLPGLHSLTLSTTGMIVYPRLESRVFTGANGDGRLAQPGIEDAPEELSPPLPADSEQPDRAGFGLPELDVLLSGGLTRGTSTVLAGSLGTGKSLLALHFALSGVRAGEPVVYVGFAESARQLVEKADAFALGAQLRAALATESGLALLRWDPVDLNPDVVADRILRALDATGARRLVVDSVIDLERAVIESGDLDRVDGYMAALVKAVRGRGISALFVVETRRVLAPSFEFAANELSVLAENVVLLQQVSYRAHMHRVLSVIKMRFSAHDLTLREFTIAPPVGIRVLTPFESGGDVLAGIVGQQEDNGAARRPAGPLAGAPESSPEDGA
jgi:circadian clock protein KaiC